MRAGLIYTGLVIAAMLAINYKPFDGYFLIKALPILFLLVWTGLNFTAGTRLWLGAALALSALGDILLALDFELQFVFGLGAFLLAQLAYGIIYFRQRDASRYWRMAVAAVLPVIVLVLVLPRAGELAIAVACYTLAIGFMLACAWGHKSPGGLIAMGASCFIISDGLIGINKFVIALPAEAYWVMASYYLAQWLMFDGLRRYWRLG